MGALVLLSIRSIVLFSSFFMIEIGFFCHKRVEQISLFVYKKLWWFFVSLNAAKALSTIKIVHSHQLVFDMNFFLFLKIACLKLRNTLSVWCRVHVNLPTFTSCTTFIYTFLFVIWTKMDENRLYLTNACVWYKYFLFKMQLLSFCILNLLLAIFI